jgi:hypothetical protein
MTEEEALAAIRWDCRTLKYMPEELKTLNVCLEAARQNIFSLVYIPEKLKPELKAVMTFEAFEAAKRDGMALARTPWELRTPEVCLAAVRQNGEALRHVPEELRERVKAGVEAGEEPHMSLYDFEVKAALPLVEALAAIAGGCANPDSDEGRDCGGCLFNLSRFERAGDDLHDWRMKLALDDWRTRIKEKQARKEEI